MMVALLGTIVRLGKARPLHDLNDQFPGDCG